MDKLPDELLYIIVQSMYNPLTILQTLRRFTELDKTRLVLNGIYSTTFVITKYPTLKHIIPAYDMIESTISRDSIEYLFYRR